MDSDTSNKSNEVTQVGYSRNTDPGLHCEGEGYRSEQERNDDDYSAPPSPNEHQEPLDRADSVSSIVQKHLSSMSQTPYIPRAISGTQIKAIIAPPVQQLIDCDDLGCRFFILSEVLGALQLMLQKCNRPHKDVCPKNIGFTPLSDKQSKDRKVMGVLTDFDRYEYDEILDLEREINEERRRTGLPPIKSQIRVRAGV